MVKNPPTCVFYLEHSSIKSRQTEMFKILSYNYVCLVCYYVYLFFFNSVFDLIGLKVHSCRKSLIWSSAEHPQIHPQATSGDQLWQSFEFFLQNHTKYSCQ